MKNSIDELKNLLIFKFSVQKVQVMLRLYVVEHVIPVDLEFTQDGVQTHLVMVELPSVDNKILQNDGWWFEVDGQSFGSKVCRDWFTDLFFGALDRWWCFPHMDGLLFSFNRN
jgi:hypothetical protein